MSGKLTDPVPGKMSLGGNDETAILIATALPTVVPTLIEWVRQLQAERLIVAGKVSRTVGEDEAVVVLRAHPARVSDIAESAPACVVELLALPHDSLP